MRALLAAFLLLSSAKLPAQDAGNIEAYGWARLRADRVNDLPGGRDDLERLRLHGYVGARWLPGPRWELGGAVKLAAGSDDNRDNRINLDNEQSDDISLGELYLRYFPSQDDFLEIGRNRLPLRLSPVIWDEDLRPVGFSWQRDIAIGSFDRLSLIGGYFAPLHINESSARLTALQASYHWREGATTAFSAGLSWLAFNDLEEIVAEGLARSNRNDGQRLHSDYRIFDLLLQARTQLAERPLELTLDLATNREAQQDDRAARLALQWGDARRHGGLELGYAIQRIQREAVLAAYNEDDWWFPTGARGYRSWVAYGFNAQVSLRAAAFVERRDDRDDHLERLLVDVMVRW